MLQQSNFALGSNSHVLVSKPRWLNATVFPAPRPSKTFACAAFDLRCAADQTELATTPDSHASLASEEVAPVCNQDVSDEDISAYAKSQHAEVFATSAKTGAGVRRLFAAIAEDLATTVQEAHVQHAHTHRHTVRPALPTFMNSRPGTSPSSPLDGSHNSTYTRTQRKYFQYCCF